MAASLDSLRADEMLDAGSRNVRLLAAGGESDLVLMCQFLCTEDVWPVSVPNTRLQIVGPNFYITLNPRCGLMIKNPMTPRNHKNNQMIRVSVRALEGNTQTSFSSHLTGLGELQV